MALYVRFMFSLAFGLLGLGLVLTIVLDELFGDWNAAHALHDDVSSFFAERSRRRDEYAERARRELERAARITQPGTRELAQRKVQGPSGMMLTVTPLPFARNQ